jgi:hypothetical protein
MYQRDYVVRMIEQFGVFLRRAAGQEDPEHSLRTVQEAGELLFGFSGPFLHSLTDDSLLALLRVGGEFDVERALMLADLSALEADVLEELGRREAAGERRRRALVLALAVSAAATDDAAAEIDERIRAFWSQAGPLATQQWAGLFRHFVSVPDFAQAEHAVFELLKVGDPTGTDRAFREEAACWLAGLLERSDEELAAAGIPRARVEDSLGQLRRSDERAGHRMGEPGEGEAC